MFIPSDQEDTTNSNEIAQESDERPLGVTFRRALSLTMSMLLLVAGLALTADGAGRSAGGKAIVATGSGTFTVNDAGDGGDALPGNGSCDTTGSLGPCTLRAALQECASGIPGNCTIGFNIPTTSGSPVTIQPTSQLPDVPQTTTIDGYTQPGSSPNTLAQGDNATIRIQIDGNALLPSPGRFSNVSGLRVPASSTLIRGIAFTNFTAGVNITGALATANRVEGCYFGLAADGVTTGPNLRGVVIDMGASGNVVGGAAAAARNISSANEYTGVTIAGSNNNTVLGNYFGTNPAGNSGVGNALHGVEVFAGSLNNRIGGTLSGEPNLISGNFVSGVRIGTTGTAGTVVQGNYIGTDATGTAALGNFGPGVLIGEPATNNTIGGTGGAGNIIAFNFGEGVAISAGTGNSIRANSIFRNSGLGIDLGRDGVTGNDPGDPDIGPNNLQNTPIITNVVYDGLNTNLTFTLNSTPSTQFAVDIFRNSVDPTGPTEGENYVQTVLVMTDASGNVPPTTVIVSSYGDTSTAPYSATATNLTTLDTSEFGFGGPADLSITKNDVTGVPVASGNPITYDIVVTNNSSSIYSTADVVDNVPPGVQFFDWFCNPSPGSICSVPSGFGPINTSVTLAPSGTVTFNLFAYTDPAARGSIVNTASVTLTSGTDPAPSNNSATSTVTLSPTYDLYIYQFSSDDSDGSGRILVDTPYTVSVQVYNDGPSAATTVTIRETLPANTTLLATPAGCIASGNLVTCIIASVPRFASVFIDFQVQTSALGPAAFTAEITATMEPEAGPGPNTNTTTFTIVPLFNPTVNTTVDAPDADPADGFCDADPTLGDQNQCSLRAAIMQSNNYPGAQTITVPPGTYSLTIPGQFEEAAATGDLDITSPMTIAGAGAGSTVVDAGAIDRVFDVLSSPVSPIVVTISGVTVMGGIAPVGTGGGGFQIKNSQVTLRDSIVTSNSADFGGGIYNFTQFLVLTDTPQATSTEESVTVGGIATSRKRASNVAAPGTNAVLAGTGLFIDHSAILSNSATSSTSGNGGGILNASASIDVRQTTFSANQALLGNGGAFANQSAGVATLHAVTIANNSASTGGGAIYTDSFSTTTIENSIVSNNVGGGCSGLSTSAGYNIEDGASCAFASTGDRSNTDPQLQPLANNGGPTPTHALPLTSPAIDAGNPAITSGDDQRHFPRPRDGNGDGSSIADIGSYEVQAAAAPAITSVTPTTGPSSGGTSITITGSNFVTGATVTINGVSASNVVVVSSTTITATTPPGSAGSKPLVVTNPDGQFAGSSFTYTTNLAITTSTLPSGAVGSPYSANLAASGGVPPYSWQLVAGSLPPGLTLQSDGSISGTPTTPGTFTFDAKVVDSVGDAITQSFPIAVSSTLTVATTSLSNGSVGALYSQTLTAAGGTPPYTWSLAAGALPPGLTLSASGNITGTPTTVGTFNFTVEVTDSVGVKASKPLAITIDGTDLAVTKTGPTSFTPGQNVTFTINVKNNGPATAAAVTLDDPTPAGLTFVSATTPCGGGFPCSLGTLPASPAVTSISVTYSVPAGYTPTTISNTATVTSSTFDPSSANNSSTVVVSGGGGADLMVTKTGPSTVSPGTKVSYTIKVENLGPAPAIGVSLFDMTSSGLIFDSASAPCAGGFPCSLGSMASGAVSTITAIFLVTQPAGVVSVTNTASVSSSSADPSASNNSSSVTSLVCPASAPEILEPAEGATFPSNPVTFRFTTPAGTKHSELYAVTSGSATPVFLGLSTGNTITADLPLGTTAVFVTGFPISEACGTKSSARRSLTVSGCPLEAPQRIAPADNTSLTSNPVTFRYSTVAGASLYEVFLLSSPTATPVSLGTSQTGTLTANVQPGTIHWYVEAIGPSESCPRRRSSTGQFSQTACQLARPNKAPQPAIPGETTSKEIYELSFTFDGGTDQTIYEIDESLDKDFTTLVSRQRVTGLTSAQFVHDVALAAGYFYRIRVVVVCQGESFLGPDSVTVRIVVLPPPPPAQFQPDQTQQFGIPDPLEQSIFIPGDDAPARSGLESQGNTGKPFTVVTSQPWLTAKPPAGTVPPQGVVVVITAVPAGLPVGTNSGTVSVVTPTPTGTSPLSTTPIAINLVTPVTPTPKNLAPPPNTLFIPSVSHVDGVRASYQSDVRIANTSGAKVRYQVSFTPSRVDGTNQGKQTIVEIEGGATIAMDDIVKRWYGLGSLGDGTLGSIEIRPLDFAGKTLTSDAFQFATVASSRTYNQTLTGSLSQFVPAVQFGDFVFKGTGPSQATVLSMQQIAQSASYRTNLGIVEGAGQAATVQVRTFNNAGTLLDTFFLTMLPAEHVQLNSVLASRNITLEDGRIEVQLMSDTGKITAFAAVIDNRSGDPLLVPGVQLSKVGASRYVVPGLSHISNDRNQWRSEMRIFNAGLSSQNVLLTFIPANNTAGAKTASLTIAPGEVKPLDNIVETTFGLTNVVGAVQVSTPSQSALVVTSRTYDSRFGGTVGQFTQSVTPDQASGIGDRALQVLQLEESSRFRTNLGLAEVGGSGSVELEITAVVPEARVAPVLRLTLAPNEFRQIGRILSQMGLSDAYNTRLSIKVMSGNGRVTAYGSVVDNVTQDPYNVQAQ